MIVILSSEEFGKKFKRKKIISKLKKFIAERAS